MFGIDTGRRTFTWFGSKSRWKRRALQPGLMHPQATEIVAMREESDIGDKTARRDVGVEFSHPCADAVAMEAGAGPRTTDCAGFRSIVPITLLR